MNDDWKEGWGLGFYVERQDETTYVGHRGWVRGYKTLLRFSPAAKIGAIVLTNSDDADPKLYAEKIFKWVAPTIQQSVTTGSVQTKEVPSQWNRYFGKYRNAWRDVAVFAYNDQLTMIEPNQSDPKESLITLIPISEHTFRMQTNLGYGNHGELVVFNCAADGRADSAKIGENLVRRIEHW